MFHVVYFTRAVYEQIYIPFVYQKVIRRQRNVRYLNSDVTYVRGQLEPREV